MKKIIVTTILLGGVCGSVLFSEGAIVHAEDSTEARTSAVVKISGDQTDPGEGDGALSITDYTATMDFGELEAPTDYSIPLVFTDGVVKVEDTTDTYEGWSLQARLSSEENQWFDGIVVRLQNTTSESVENFELTSENVQFHSHESASESDYVTEKIVNFSASVLIPVGITPGEYHNDIIWTLSAGPN